MRGKFTLLVAEDSETDALLLTHAVTTLGEEVDLQVTRDGAEVVSYLRGEGEYGDRERHPLPDLIMLDLQMPRLNGLGVLEWLRDHSDCGQIPKIVMSGSGLVRDVEECYRLGANTYFMKPSGMQELRELMRLIVSYWSLSQRLVLHHSC